MAENKTRPEKTSVNGFIDTIENPGRKADAKRLLDIMKRVTGLKPVMWGTSIVGFGQYHYKYDSGREGDMLLVGFSPRKANMVVYITPGFSKFKPLLAKLGKHKTGKSCLYLPRLEKIDQAVLADLIEQSFLHMKEKYNVA